MARPEILAVERATLTAVPAPVLAFEGGFVVRRFLGGTGRANAACGLDPRPDPDLPRRVDRIEAFYARAGQPCRFRSTVLDPEGLEALLAARGYTGRDESQVICGRLSGFARPDPAAEMLAGPEQRWLAVVATAEHQSEARRAEKAGMAGFLGVPAAWVLLHEDGVPAASAFVTADGELAGLFDLAVRPEFRRRGLGQRVMAAAGAWAASQGARWAYAQVSCTNLASLAMNARLGMTELYRYRYLMSR
ncbi:GNAT family N-acetyltransferase [Falsiroseomonas sp. HC035]|uniref:GNAT family N-acetyltransferase n=1 Tax=Falsiroseomonas sp. HC035 TaxID=3390999 RepID=UPI003D30FF4F